MNQEKWFTLGEGVIYLGTTDKSLRKYLRELGEKPIPHTGDQRMKYYSQTQLNMVADAKGLIPGQKPPNMRTLARDIRDLRHEVADLQQELETIRKELEIVRQRQAELRHEPVPPLLPARPARAPVQHLGVPLAQFVARHISDPMNPTLAVEQALAQWSQPRDRERIRRAENLHYRDRRQLVQSWAGKAGYHQCKEDIGCPCRDVLQKLPEQSE